MTAGTRVILCGEAAAGRLRGSKDALCLRNTGTHRNVHLQIDDISRTLATNIPPQLIDLIEIATFVYVADQSIPRGGDGVEEMGVNWRRSLHFEVPVRHLDLWRRDEVASALQDVLSFLSEDEYTFTFRSYQKPPSLDGYLHFAELDYGFQPERVMLFSGGLDSLGGVIDEIVLKGTPVALVTHEATTKLRTRMRMLREAIDARAKGPKPLPVTVRINKDENLNHEYTQRSRSFLYASLAAAIARMCGLSAIRFYENGTVSLNLPISWQVIGSRATRTTHPRVLAGFARLFSLVTDGAFTVDNGFLWLTKDQVIGSIVGAGCGGMIEWSTSCAHMWEISREKPHCGKCSQCIDRRFAILAADAGAHERADTYGIDLLTGTRDAGESRTMLAAYVETAQQVDGMKETDFFMRFGEAARVVRYLDGSPDVNARQIYDLYRRHAQAVLRVIDKGLVQHASQIRARSLPESCLLRLVHDPTISSTSGPDLRPSPPSVGESAEPYIFRQRGEGWQLRFDGHDVLWFKPTIGYAYLRELLRLPGKRFSVSELLVAVYGKSAALSLSDGDEILDSQARKGYALRLREIEDEYDEARVNNDLASQSRLETERQQLVAEAGKASFRISAKRNKSDRNNLRNSVCIAIRRALEAIERYEPSAFAHLKSSISLGFSVCYNPPSPVPWSF